MLRVCNLRWYLRMDLRLPCLHYDNKDALNRAINLIWHIGHILAERKVTIYFLYATYIRISNSNDNGGKMSHLSEFIQIPHISLFIIHLASCRLCSQTLLVEIIAVVYFLLSILWSLKEKYPFFSQMQLEPICLRQSIVLPCHLHL